MNELPPLQIENVQGMRVVRDDIVAGGTKTRALMRWLPTIDAEEFVYASPRQGYAQLALAVCAKLHGKRATVFCAQSAELHPITAEAKGYGAKIVQIGNGYLSNVTAKAKAYAQETGAHLLPFGLHDDLFIKHMSDAARESGETPSEVWCVAASGTLAAALSMAWPSAKLNVVRVGAIRPLPEGAIIHHAPERYEQNAKRPPPFESCSNYDAKAWQFIRAYAAQGALFWNVAGNIH